MDLLEFECVGVQVQGRSVAAARRKDGLVIFLRRELTQAEV